MGLIAVNSVDNPKPEANWDTIRAEIDARRKARAERKALAAPVSRTLIIVLIAAAAMSILVFLGSLSSPQGSKVTVPESRDYPMMLATIDGNDGDPVKVNRYRSLLGQLDGAFVETPEQIADMSANAKSLMAEGGVAEDILPIMEGMNVVLPVRIENQKYAEYTAAYMTLRVKGETHEGAIRGMKALIRSIISRP